MTMIAVADFAARLLPFKIKRSTSQIKHHGCVLIADHECGMPDGRDLLALFLCVDAAMRNTEQVVLRAPVLRDQLRRVAGLRLQFENSASIGLVSIATEYSRTRVTLSAEWIALCQRSHTGYLPWSALVGLPRAAQAIAVVLATLPDRSIGLVPLARLAGSQNKHRWSIEQQVRGWLKQITKAGLTAWRQVGDRVIRNVSAECKQAVSEPRLGQNENAENGASEPQIDRLRDCNLDGDRPNLLDMTPSDDTPSAASQGELRTIQTSRGAYRLVRRIGRGGFGKVYEAEALLPLGQRRRCAIKFMAEKLVTNKLAIEQFVREARTGIKVAETSPNLVTTTDFGECPERGLFLVMQLIEGPSLATARGLIRGEMPLIRRIAWDGLAGLGHLHGHGLIHRDISPSNILLAQDGMVKLTDFGLTKPPNEPWDPESVAGVSGYIAPELQLLREATHKSDLFSLGAVLYELIAGKPPYSEIVTGVGSRPAPSLPDDIPADVKQLVHGLVVIDPELRMSSAEAIELLGDAPRATNEVIIQLAATWTRYQAVLRGEGELQPKTQPDHSSAELIRALSRYEPPGAMQAPAAPHSPLWKENCAQNEPQPSQAEPLLGAERESQPASTRATDAVPDDSCQPDGALFILPPMSSEHPPLNPARTSADGKYTLLHTIGEGGMAKVYAAEWRLPDQPVQSCAIKFMKPDESRHDFSQEALFGLNFARHANLVAVYDYGVWPGGIPFQVMERVHGPNLEQACSSEHGSRVHSDPLVVRRIALDIAMALQHLHLHDILHCDVSPVNILLSPDGHVRLVDLGVSRKVSKSPARQFRGLPAFASPEALDCDVLDPISDAYSLGAVLYWMLTGKPPYGFGDPMKVRDAMKKEPPSLPDIIPADLAALIRALLNLNRSERHSVDEAIDDLQYSQPQPPIADTRWIAFLVAQWFSNDKPAKQPAALPDVAEPDRKTDKQDDPVDAALRQHVEQQASSQGARPSLDDAAHAKLSLADTEPGETQRSDQTRTVQYSRGSRQSAGDRPTYEPAPEPARPDIEPAAPRSNDRPVRAESSEPAEHQAPWRWFRWLIVAGILFLVIADLWGPRGVDSPPESSQEQAATEATDSPESDHPAQALFKTAPKRRSAERFPQDSDDTQHLFKTAPKRSTRTSAHNPH